MSLGFFIWLVIACLILGFFGWSVSALLRQKKAWAAYAHKFALAYDEGKFFQTPSVEGDIDGRYIRFYESKEADVLGRPVSKMTLEVELKKSPPCPMAITHKSQQYVFNGVTFPAKVTLTDKEWDRSHLIGTPDSDLTKSYLTPLRLRKLHAFLMMKKAANFFIVTPDRAFLMVQTTQILDNPKRIHMLLKKLFMLAYVLEENKEPQSVKTAKPTPAKKKADKEESKEKTEGKKDKENPLPELNPTKGDTLKGDDKKDV